MISREAALQITAASFPNGPETLAEYLSVQVGSAPLMGVEGWCIRGPKTIIRLNSSSTRFRQRFTLAHEMAHVILGTEPDIPCEPFHSDRQEERDADQLAAEFLISDARIKISLGNSLPVDAKTLERLAKEAQVSPVMVACRLVNATPQLGLINSAVVYFQNGEFQWRHSHGLTFNPNEAIEIFKKAFQCKPNPVRIENHDGHVVVGSIINAQVYQVLLIQLLSQENASQQTREERLRVLAIAHLVIDRPLQQIERTGDSVAAKFLMCRLAHGILI